MYSATQRANGGRSRHRHSGQTASIYLTEKVAEERGKFQIGTLVHTIAIKQGPVILDSVPGVAQKDVQPLFGFLPANTPTFTDDGYPWLSRYNRNHRAVNHSARAKDKKRNVWARNRWSRGGVHNQVAEGTQRMVKASFLAAYGYFNPKYSQLYLNEYSALKSIRVYGLESLLKAPIVCNVDPRYSGSPFGGLKIAPPDFLRRKITENQYIPPGVAERGFYDNQNSRRQIRGKLRDLFNDNDYFEAKQAHIDYLNFWQDAPRWKRQHERKYGATARKLWTSLSRWQPDLLSNIARKHELSHPLCMRIAREWSRLNLAEVEEIPSENSKDRQIHYWVRRKIDTLPDLLYSWDMDTFREDAKSNHPAVTRVAKAERIGKAGMTRSKRTQYIEEMMR
ncbi:MAG: transposase [bacterium]|nr:transposase [bacterium]